MILLAVDVTAVIISAIGAVVSLGTVALTLMINRKVDKVGKEIDGKMTQLLEVTGAKERAEGKAEGKTEQRTEAKEDNKASVTDVKIVDQEKPVDVSVTKTDKK